MGDGFRFLSRRRGRPEAITLMRADTTGLRTDTVQRLLGRKPATFTDWCARNAGLFRQAAAAT
jgi:hypothetical protein